MEIRTIQPFLHYFGNVRERTMRVARDSSLPVRLVQFEGGADAGAVPVGTAFGPRRSTAA
jgi:hypothetical protein